MAETIGIPRALMYHYYYPAWEVFFQELGLEIVLSQETNKRILDEGIRRTVDDLCLPFKVYFGHLWKLLGRVNYLFIPRLISLGRNNMVCPKFMGLPDMVRATFTELPRILEPAVDLRKSSLKKIAFRLGNELGAGYLKTGRAYRRAVQRQADFQLLEQEGYSPEECLAVLRGGERPLKGKGRLRVAVLGHAYLVNDRYLSMDITGQLKGLGVEVITLEMLKPELLEKAAGRQPKKSFWYYNRQVMGGAYYFLNRSQAGIDGIVQLAAFGCGPDSMIRELIDIRCRREGLPILNINLDEHSGEAGLVTRLEAFIDLLDRKGGRL